MKKRKIIGIILLVLILGAGAYVYSIYHSLTKAVNTMHNPVDRKSSREKEIRFKDKDPISILMLGVDERKGDRGRSDTMIVLTVNPTVKSVQMLSIPRDTRVEIVGKGTEDKINHAYAFGGVAMSMNTVEKFLDIPVDYYIKVNMEGFEDIVNAVGGVTVNNTLDFSYGGYHFPKGEVNLDGKKALAFVRMRKEDPRGDFGRNDRQRQVIQGVISKGASVSALTKYNDVFETLGKNVETNLTFDEMMSIQKYYKDARHKIEQFQLKGQGTKIGGIYYYIVPQDEKQKAHNRLKQHLEL
ncbi:LytR family transcriptional regulator [Heyndrickxia sporothermodurans]|nr:LytR family transcriptional regulator [Heyndrickxia sporothermodurans]MBL5769779.1 LytR family transcriptional regulator [Heyndrickxia sporothermodurans]MBL5773971.1 LytR family transcriptional regulator [Heyndrickxia sporothermodurans]MBL5776859.1 LytR family transcriptional regulator [Heyndrickxia sporothermodurans]MBL5781263.1 LytR family transcriptional regulator [Heyndrickxia sporothermodurans]